jgi:hypothetical protein
MDAPRHGQRAFLLDLAYEIAHDLGSRILLLSIFKKSFSLANPRFAIPASLLHSI